MESSGNRFDSLLYCLFLNKEALKGTLADLEANDLKSGVRELLEELRTWIVGNQSKMMKSNGCMTYEQYMNQYFDGLSDHSLQNLDSNVDDAHNLLIDAFCAINGFGVRVFQETKHGIGILELVLNIHSNGREVMDLVHNERTGHMHQVDSVERY